MKLADGRLRLLGRRAAAAALQALAHYCKFGIDNNNHKNCTYTHTYTHTDLRTWVLGSFRIRCRETVGTYPALGESRPLGGVSKVPVRNWIIR
jgi:hypothetical protein